MTCRACGSDRLTPVFEMDPMPLAGAFAATADEAKAMPRYPLTWLLCGQCDLVNVDPDIPDRDIFDTYSYAASTVPALVRHHAEFASVLRRRYDKVALLEIGCNDGVLLNQLPNDWYRLGVDPSDVAAKADRAYDLLNEPFDERVGEALEDTFDVVVSSNSFAHFTDIGGALRGVAHCLRIGGEFWLEVHSLSATLAFGQWDTIYHEHKAEWSISAIAGAIEPLGFELASVEFRELHGGTLRARLVRGPKGETETSNHPDWDAFQQTYSNRVPVKADAAYGAAARASVYLNQCDTGAEYVVDASPLRAGRFVPGLGIPIVGPEAFTEPDRTLITAWNNADDIRARHPDYEGWVTAW